MQETIDWNLETALNLTCTLRQFIKFISSDESKYVDKALISFDNYKLWSQSLKNEIDNKLCQVLEVNNWIISCQKDELKYLRHQGKLICARGEILIIKGYSEVNISAIVNENSHSYFLVAALSWNGKSIVNWHHGKWYNYLLENQYKENEIYYFYYCKMNLERIHKYLRFNYYPVKYQGYYQVLENIWKYNQLSDDTTKYQLSCNELLSIDASLEENQYEFLRENDEDAISKLRKENDENKSIIACLESKRIELEEKLINHENCQNRMAELEKSNNFLKYENESLKNENQMFKSKANDLISVHDKEKIELEKLYQSKIKAIEQLQQNLSEKETQISKLEEDLCHLKVNLSEKETELSRIIESNKRLEEKLKNLEEEEINKTNYSQKYHDSGNEIVKLLPNRKHGLPNFGNTCYLNSLLQILASTPLFISKIESINSPFCNNLASLLLSMHVENSFNKIKDLTQNLYQKLMETYSNIGQWFLQDVKEILNMILSKIEEDGGNLDVFSVAFHQVFSCSWYHQSKYDDIQNFLIIPPQQKDSPESYIKNQINYGRSTQSLICNTCSREVDMNIWISSIDWPAYLILYFPVPPCHITEFIQVSYETSYEMYGAICYYQDEGNFHYTAFTKDESEWNEYNDEHVETKRIDSRVVNLAFYSKKP